MLLIVFNFIKIILFPTIFLSNLDNQKRLGNSTCWPHVTPKVTRWYYNSVSVKMKVSPAVCWQALILNGSYRQLKNFLVGLSQKNMDFSFVLGRSWYHYWDSVDGCFVVHDHWMRTAVHISNSGIRWTDSGFFRLSRTSPVFLI
jgi:hypothetical protein